MARLPEAATQLEASRGRLQALNEQFKRGEFGAEMPFTGCMILVFGSVDQARLAAQAPDCEPCPEPTDLIWENIGTEFQSLWILPLAFTAIAGLLVTLLKLLVREHLE